MGARHLRLSPEVVETRQIYLSLTKVLSYLLSLVTTFSHSRALLSSYIFKNKRK
jgi:hypothetical protein